MREVWVIDDDEEMGRAIGLMLKLLDCETTLFLSARPAVQSLLTGKRPDLMIVDINMPEVSGLDLVEFLRRRQEWKNMPIVMLSSEASDVMVDKALRYGADSYVTKPVTLEELEQAMEQAFSRHKIGA
jgi:two-component system, chemotaxis family, chemotaxis protein CheY